MGALSNQPSTTTSSHDDISEDSISDTTGSTRAHLPVRSAQTKKAIRLPKLSKEDYTIAWICALPVPEFSASRFLIDTPHEELPLPRGVRHQYVYGTICGHNVVLGCLPDGQLGEISASAVLAEMLSTFPNLSFALMVGIGGGVWSATHDVRLGDVVVSYPSKDHRHGGVKQYDFGKAVQGQGFKEMGSLNMPGTTVLSGLSKVRTSPPETSKFLDYLGSFESYTDQLTGKPCFETPFKEDVLYKSNSLHRAGQSDCETCDHDARVTRTPRSSSQPVVHYGLIASGNEVIKDATKRDQIWEAYDRQVLCFEMEAAGMVNQISCLVVRGICDYCDSHKNKAWQPYAAAVAASWAKEFLRNIATDERTDAESAALLSLMKREDHLVRLNHDQLVKSTRSKHDVEATIDRISGYKPLQTIKRLARLRTRGTIRWIQTNPIFRDWRHDLTDTSRILCLSGKVGCGKTFVIERAVDIMLDATNDKPKSLVLHWFCQQASGQASDAIRSLAKQTLRHLTLSGRLVPEQALTGLDDCFGEQNRTANPLDIVELIILPLISGVDDLTICIDGIDEFSFEEREKIRVSLTHILTHKTARLLLTTQDIHNWQNDELEVLKIHLDIKMMSNDIEIYADTRLQALTLPGRILENQMLYMNARHQLLSQANGMFLWVKLVLDLLEDCDTAGQVAIALERFPTGLEEAYERCIRRRRKGVCVCRPKILRWVSLASEPITISQLREMLAIDPSTGQYKPKQQLSAEAVGRAGVGLISVDEIDGSVMPVHRSVRQYLFSTSLQRLYTKSPPTLDIILIREFQACRDETSAVLELAQLSMQHIDAHTTGHMIRHAVQAPPIIAMIPGPLQSMFGMESRRYTQRPMMTPPAHTAAIRTQFMQWAIRTWPDHTHHISKRHPAWDLFQGLALGLSRTENVHPWCERMPQTQNVLLRRLLGYAVAHDHEPLLSLVLANKSSLPKDIFDHVLPANDQMLPLHLASKMGYVRIVQTLLKVCNVRSKCPSTGMSALHHAAAAGHLQIVDLLVQHLKKISALIRNDNLVDDLGRTPVYYAALNDHYAIIHILLDQLDKHLGTPRDIETGRTPLWIAAHYGHVASAKTLLFNGGYFNQPDHSGVGPLLAAIENGHEKLACEILRMPDPSTPNARANDGRTPLTSAIKHGQLRVLKLLLDFPFVGINHRASDTGWTPLMYAVHMGRATVVELLTGNAEVNPNLQDLKGWTALLHALSRDRQDLTELILKMPALDPARALTWDDSSWSILVQSGNIQILKLLVDFSLRGDHPVAVTNPLGDGVRAAARYKQEAMLEVLLTYIGDCKTQASTDAHATTLLRAKEHHIPYEEARKCPLSSKDSAGRTALSYAAEHGFVTAVKTLLRHNDIAVDLRDKQQSTTLAHAVMASRVTIVGVLLERPDLVQPNGRILGDQTILCWAAKHSELNMVQTLLSYKGLEVHRQDKQGRSALSFAAERGLTDMVSALIDSVQARSSHMELTTEGLTRPVTLFTIVNAEDAWGWTPLFWAIDSQNTECVKRLLETGLIHYLPRDRVSNACALCHAAAKGNVNMVKALVDSGSCSSSSTDKDLRTPLCLAAIAGNTDTVCYLLDHAGVDLHHKDYWGFGAVYYAIEQGHLALLQALAKRTNLEQAITKSGETAIDIAIELDKTEIAAWLGDQIPNQADDQQSWSGVQ